MTHRIPCINPRCRRTAAQDKFPGSSEIICGKCFRVLPVSLRRRQKAYWRRDRLLLRLARKAGEERRLQLERIQQRHGRLGESVWEQIHTFFRPADKPAGLDAFLEEMGL